MTTRVVLAGIVMAGAALVVPAPAADAQVALRSDSVARDFFPARMVLEHAAEIGLTDQQRAVVEAEARRAQEQFGDLRFDLEDAVRRLIGLSNVHPVDEEAAVAQLEQILDLERRIKILQLSLVVRVKNVLTPEQQQQLRELRRRSAGAGDPRQR